MNRRNSTAWVSAALSCAVAAVVLLQGCANALTPLGENKYDCNRKENPASPYCHSFKSVETATNGTIPASRFDEPMSVGDHDRLTGIAPVPAAKMSAHMAASQGSSTVQYAPVQPSLGIAPGAAASAIEGLPVRVGPVVQRIWVKRFVDRNDLLVGDTVIYKEVIGSHWLGFDTNANPVAAATSAKGAYPHRSSNAQPASSKGTPANTDRDAAPQPRNSFSQPGLRGPGSGDVVPAPATEAPPVSGSGVSSMPQ
jgi:conjugal transfer pilus assembly protein TraV